MPNLTEMLNIILALDQSDLQKRRAALEEQDFMMRREDMRNRAAQMPIQNLETFHALVEHSRNPAELNGVIDTFAARGVPRAALQSLASQHILNSPLQNAAIQSDFVRAAQGESVPGWTPEYAEFARGVATAQGQGQGVGQAAAQEATRGLITTDPRVQFGAGLRGATGQSAGQFALDQALFGFTPEDLTRAMQMQVGLELTEPQAVQARQTDESQALQAQIAADAANRADRGMAQQGILGVMGLDNRLEAAAMQAQARRETEAELRKNIELLTRNATTAAAGGVTLQLIRRQYNEVFGPGEFEKAFGANPNMDPSLIARIAKKMGG